MVGTSLAPKVPPALLLEPYFLFRLSSFVFRCKRRRRSFSLARRMCAYFWTLGGKEMRAFPEKGGAMAVKEDQGFWAPALPKDESAPTKPPVRREEYGGDSITKFFFFFFFFLRRN